MSTLSSIGDALANLPIVAAGRGGLQSLEENLIGPDPSAIYDEVVTMAASVAAHQAPPMPMAGGGGGLNLGNQMSGIGHLDLIADQCGGDSSGSSLGNALDAVA